MIKLSELKNGSVVVFPMKDVERGVAVKANSKWLYAHNSDGVVVDIREMIGVQYLGNIVDIAKKWTTAPYPTRRGREEEVDVNN